MTGRTHRLAYLALAALTAVGVARAGSLEPPGPPAPTMKTLAQIEPVPVESLPGWPTVSYVIDEPGSYLLTRNLIGEPGKSGIIITAAASDVTLDLNGFAVIGDGTGDWGITVAGPRATVRNGSIRNWVNAALSAVGPNSLFEDVVAYSNGAGFQIQEPGAVLRGCTARDNGSGFIVAADSVTIRDSTASSNDFFDVDLLGRGGLLDNSSVWHEPDPIGAVGAVRIGGGSNTVLDSRIIVNAADEAGILVIGNGASAKIEGNTITTTPAATGATAIRAQNTSVIQENILILESDDARGVEVDTAPSVVDKNFISGTGTGIIAILVGASEGNGVTGNRIALTGSSGVGISIAGGSGYIEQNNISLLGVAGTGITHGIIQMSGLMENNFVMLRGASGVGISAPVGAGDLILSNTVVGAGTAYSIGSGNQEAQVVTDPGSGFAISGSTNLAVGPNSAQ